LQSIVADPWLSFAAMPHNNLSKEGTGTTTDPRAILISS
jgi:hypothetical protein